MNHRSTIDERLRMIIRDLVFARVPLAVAERAFKVKYIDETLVLCGGNQTKTAAALGVHRNTVVNHLLSLTKGEINAKTGKR